MNALTALLIAAAVCLVLAGLIFWRYNNDSNDGDFGIGVLFFLLLAAGITLLFVALVVFLWQHVGWT